MSETVNLERSATGVTSALPASVTNLIELLGSYGIDGGEMAKRIAKALSPDSDVNGIASAIVLRIFCVETITSAIASSVAAQEAVARAKDLHSRFAAGVPVGEREWIEARSAALAATEGADETAATVIDMAASAAWLPGSSRTVLTDLFQSWVQADRATCRKDDPWTEALEDLAQATLHSIADEHQDALERGERLNFQALFAARDPDLARGFADNINRYSERAKVLATRAASMIVDACNHADDDPYEWLEEVEGMAALRQVREWNARTDALVRGDPDFSRLEARARDILDDDRRIAFPVLLSGYVYNFWSDANHVRGIWRRTRETDYLAGNPRWETILDIDNLGRDEGRNWVWQGATVLQPDGDRCLVSLSDGGRDAATVREFDLRTLAFVADGFVVPEAKTQATWLDRDTILVASDFGPGSLTVAEYPRQVRRWTRGTSLDQASIIDTVETEDMLISPFVTRDSEGVWPMISRARSFWSSQVVHIASDGSVHPSPLPHDATLYGSIGGYAIAMLQSDHALGPAGSLVAYSIKEVLAGRFEALELVLPPPRDGANEGVGIARSVVYVSRLQEVRGDIVALRRDGPGDWRVEQVPTPNNSSVFIVAANETSDRLYFVTVGLTQPQRLNLFEPQAPVRDVASAPERFDPDCFTVSQRFATSEDGTRIPYFLVLPRDASGPVPVLLYSYGGFRQSLVPGYIGPLAQFLLENGGGYAVANIRGGGEFGPSWHAAALRENRQRSFDDFHSVAADLRTTGVASTLGIHGGSNGGLLVGVAYTQRPELYDAVVMSVPLADMKRYHKLLAGASWIEEYGDPDKPDDWDYIRSYSPYHNLTSAAQYPPVLFQTSTKDDRVHPAHARKMAARMDALGHNFDYYENIDGGHGGAADNSQAAYQVALMTIWLRDKLRTPRDRKEDVSV